MALNINNTTPGPSSDPSKLVKTTKDNAAKNKFKLHTDDNDVLATELKLVKITPDNISDYPGLDAKFIGYDIFVNQIHNIAEFYTDVLVESFVDNKGFPKPKGIYKDVLADFDRATMYINNTHLENAFNAMYKSNKKLFDALNKEQTLDEFIRNVEALFPGTSLLNKNSNGGPSHMEIIYEIMKTEVKDMADAKAEAKAEAPAKIENPVNNNNDSDIPDNNSHMTTFNVIPFIYSIYNKYGIRDNNDILQYMVFMQQGSQAWIWNCILKTYDVLEIGKDNYDINLTTSNFLMSETKINEGDFSGKPADKNTIYIQTIKDDKMNAIQDSTRFFTKYMKDDGTEYVLSINNPITYFAYPANRVYLLTDTIWRNDSVHKAHDLIKQLNTSVGINQRFMRWYMYKILCNDYTNSQIQPTLVNIFDLLLKITDLAKRVEIFDKLQPIMDKILASPSSFIAGELQYLYSVLFDAESIDKILNAESIAQIEAKLKDFDTCDDADIDSSCKANERLLPNDPTFFNRVSQRVTQKAKDVYRGRITPLNKEQAIEAAKSASLWAIKAYEWSKKDSIAGAQSALEKIEAIKSNLDASAKQYKEDMSHDTSLYKTYNPIYEQILVSSKKVDTALNFASAVVILDTLRQQPEGIGKNVNVVNSLVMSTFNDIKKMQDASEEDVDVDVGVVDGVEEEKAADDEEEVVAEDESVVDEEEEEEETETDNGVEEEKTAEVQPIQLQPQLQPQPQPQPQLVATSNGLVDPMCNNKQKWEEYYKAARPVVNHPIEPDKAWQTEQQSAAKCGHHSLHNLFHNAWTKTECPPKNIQNRAITNKLYIEHVEADSKESAQITSLKEYNQELINVLKKYNENQPIDLYNLCRINRRFQLLDGRGPRTLMDDCMQEGNYSPGIIRNALNIAGYPTFEIDNSPDIKYTTEEYCKFIIDQFQSGISLIGMILVTGKLQNEVGHFIEVRKNNDDEIEVIDTLYKANPGSPSESAKLTLELNGNKGALATQLNAWMGQAVYKNIYGVIGVFPFSGKYVPARLDQYFDFTPFSQEYKANTGHAEIYTDEAGNIFQKKDTARPNQPNLNTTLINTCEPDGAVDREFSIRTTEVRYVPIYIEDVGVKGGRGRRSKKQRGGANPVESSVKDLYDIAMMLLNLNGELIEKSESQPSEQSDQSNLTNTLTILLNTRIPGKRNLLYKPQMTIPNTTSSQVWFDPRIKLKKSIVNKPQPLPPPVPQPQSPRTAQNRYQLPNGYQRYNQRYNQPYNAQNRYQMPNNYEPYYNPQVQYGGVGEGEGKGETPTERKEIYTQFFNRNEFNNLLLRTMNESPQQIPDLATAKEEGITDNNIQVTLDTLFKSDNVIYIEGAPYTIYAHDWIIGDWQIDTRPNIYVDSSTRFQLQAPTYTSYGVIIPKTSNIAIFEEQAKKERSEIPIALQRGDALEMSSKINKAIKSVLSHVAQNKKPRLTSADIMKKASPWELAKLVERQMANRAYEPTRDEMPNYVNVEPSSVAANARVASVEKANARAKALADARAKLDADEKAKIAKAEADAVQLQTNIETANKELEESIQQDAKIDQENEELEQEEAQEEAKINKDEALITLTKDADTEEQRAIKEQRLANLKLARQALVDKQKRRLAGYAKAKQTRADKKAAAQEATEKFQAFFNALPPDIKKFINIDLVNGTPKLPPLPTDIDSRLRRQFSNALIESTKLGFWTPASVRKYLSDDSVSSNAIDQIKLWKVSEERPKNDMTLQRAIFEIVDSITGTTQAMIDKIYDVFMDFSDDSDELIIFRCEAICNIKFILMQSVPAPVVPPSFTLNQRVQVETTTDERERIAAMNQFKQVIDKGVIVKELDDNTYNVLTDEYEMKEGIGDGNPRIQHVDGFTIANIPTLEMYDAENGMDLLRNFEKCAFILYDNSNKTEQPTYRAIYKQNIRADTQTEDTSRQKRSNYVFDLNRIPSYLYYMIFLASYKFNKPVGDAPIGDFVINDESPYRAITILNRKSKAKNQPKSLDALYNIYDKNLSIKLPNIYNKEPLPDTGLSLGPYLFQMGGGPEDDLARAIETNNIDDIQTLLKDDATLINKTDANGNTILMIACKSKNLGIVKTLLEMGAQGTINKQNAVGDTALHIACKNGYAAIASVLVLNGADLTIKNVLGKTPIEVCTDPALKAKMELHLANVKKMFEFVKNNRTQDLQQLLKTFRGVNLVDLTTGDTPLHIACQLGNKDIALLLIQAGANPTLKNNNGQTPFELVENETLKANLQDQYNLTQALFKAVENNSLPEVKQILDRLPPNQVSILVNSRTNPESSGQGETSLHIAVKNGDREMVKFLLDKGADVNVGDKYEATPLHFACRNGDGYIARMLVEFGGDLTIKAIDGRTPLDACKTNELRIDLIKDYIEKLARDKKLNLPKGTRLSSANDEASIKKALAYYLKSPKKIESKNSYYVVMDLDLYPGKSISTAQKARMQCSRVWDNIQEAWADSRGADYVPKEQDISKAPKVPVATEVPVAQARPIRRERTRRRYGGKKGGSTRRCASKKCRGPKTRKHKRTKHKSNSRRVKK